MISFPSILWPAVAIGLMHHGSKLWQNIQKETQDRAFMNMRTYQNETALLSGRHIYIEKNSHKLMTNFFKGMQT